MTKEECDHLKSLAKKSIVLEHELKDYQSLKTEFPKLQKAYNELRYEKYKLQNCLLYTSRTRDIFFLAS